MQSNASAMRKLMEMAEASYQGAVDHPDISYDAVEKGGEITKVIANLQSYESGRYTKLGRNLKRIEFLEKQVKKLKDQTKQESRELVADLFNAEDAARTRVVETVSFTFELTKDPKPSETVKYAKVLEELENHLTPELVAVMETLVAKHTSFVQKAPALKTTDKRKTESLVTEGPLDKLKGFFANLKHKIESWALGYDSKLEKLKAEVAHMQGVVGEAAPKGLMYDRNPDLSTRWVVVNTQAKTRVGHGTTFPSQEDAQDYLEFQPQLTGATVMPYNDALAQGFKGLQGLAHF